jgi:hypothetical protein
MTAERYRHVNADIGQCGDPEPDPRRGDSVCRWCGEPLERYTPITPDDFPTDPPTPPPPAATVERER